MKSYGQMRCGSLVLSVHAQPPTLTVSTSFRHRCRKPSLSIAWPVTVGPVSPIRYAVNHISFRPGFGPRLVACGKLTINGRNQHLAFVLDYDWVNIFKAGHWDPSGRRVFTAVPPNSCRTLGFQDYSDIAQPQLLVFGAPLQ